jgi:enamine deaminase RidA (YjgF/YER057c/UK114 family)
MIERAGEGRSALNLPSCCLQPNANADSVGVRVGSALRTPHQIDQNSKYTTEEAEMPARRGEPIVPAVWADFYEQTHIPAALRVGDILRVTGHTGETADGVFSTDSETQIRQVFRNLALTLAEVGASWSNVVEINSYHVGLVEQSEVLIRVAAEFLDDPYPAWTAVGVTELIVPEALVEISCLAML